MALPAPFRVKAGSFNIGTGGAGSQQTISSLWPESAEPDLIVFAWSGNTSTSGSPNIELATHLRGMGWAARSTSCIFISQGQQGGGENVLSRTHSATLNVQRAVATRDEDAAASAIADVSHSTADCIVQMGDGGRVARAFVASVGSGSFTVEIRGSAFTVDLNVEYWAFTGLLAMTHGVTTGPSGGGAIAIGHNLQEKPSAFLMLGGTVAGLGGDASDIDSTLSFGVAALTVSGGLNQACIGVGANEASASGSTGTYIRGGECFAGPAGNPGTGAPGSRCSATSFSTSDVNLNFGDRENADIFWMAISGGVWDVVEFTASATLDAEIRLPYLGFQPLGAMFVTGVGSESGEGAVPNAHDVWSVGVASTQDDGATVVQRCQAVASRDGNTTMFTQNAAAFDKVHLRIDPTTDTLEGHAAVSDFHDPIRLTQTNADPSPPFGFCVAVGEFYNQIARPDGDVSDGTWIGQPGSVPELAAQIDEVEQDDGDYIESAADPVDDTCEVTLSDVTAPQGTVTIVVRHQKGS